MSADPAFLAVTLPFLFTIATFLLLLLHFIFCLVPVNFKVTDFFTFSVIICLFILGASTVTLQVYFFLPTFAVIVAEPFFLAVTTPLDDTAATDFLLLDHFTLPFVPDNFNCIFCPVTSVALLLLIFPAADTGTVRMRIKSKVVTMASIFFDLFIRIFLPINNIS